MASPCPVGPRNSGQSCADATKNVAWKQSIPGHGWSSPVVAKGRVYLTTAVAGEGTAKMSFRCICLNETTGKIAWNTEVFTPTEALPRIHDKNSHASPTPLIADERIYVHFGHQGTACLDLTGKVLWRNDTLAYPPVHGSGGSLRPSQLKMSASSTRIGEPPLPWTGG